MIPKISFDFTSRLIPSRIFAPPIARLKSLTLNAGFKIVFLFFKLFSDIETAKPGSKPGFAAFRLLYAPTLLIALIKDGTYFEPLLFKETRNIG